MMLPMYTMHIHICFPGEALVGQILHWLSILIHIATDNYDNNYLIYINSYISTNRHESICSINVYNE